MLVPGLRSRQSRSAEQWNAASLCGAGVSRRGAHRGDPPELPLPPRTSGHTPCAWSSVRICLVTTTNTEVP